jgi:putative sigma-54 modulation protein
MKPELMDYTKEKIGGLSKYYDKIVGIEVYLKLGQEAEENKVVEVKLNIPGNDIHAVGKAAKFEGAINEAVDKLKGQIRKIKTKLVAHH